MYKRIHIIVMDSVGVGAMPDAAEFGDEGSNTLGHIADSCPMNIPNLQKLGIGNIVELNNIAPADSPAAYYGKMAEASCGKDTMTGHWEMMGLFIDKPFRAFPEFPDELIRKIESYSGRKVIGNKAASGTDIIDELGAEQMATGALIVYTSADSVLQIAAHEQIIPLKELYDICAYCRKITLDEPYTIGRIIARPYIGSPGAFKRTSNRHDYALKPYGRTVLDSLKDSGLDVLAIGKIRDIFDGEGISRSISTVSNEHGMQELIKACGEDVKGISFLNLVDFDALYGHRRDVSGYAKAIEAFDLQLGELLEKLTDSDLLILTADHGNDPAFKGTDHTREFVPLLVYSPALKGTGSLGLRKTFADIGASVAENFDLEKPRYGASFLSELI